MSTTRLYITKELLDQLDILDKIGQHYKEEHFRDGLYHQLEIMLRDTFNDTHLDYVGDFANSYALIRFFDKEAKELEAKKERGDKVTLYSLRQTSIAKAVKVPLERLITEVGLFKQAKGLSEEEQKACDLTLKELKSLEANAKQVMEFKS